MNLYNEGDYFQYGYNKITKNPKESEIPKTLKEIDVIIEELKKEKIKTYNFKEYLNESFANQLTFYSSLFISIPLFILYFLNIFTFKNVEFFGSIGYNLSEYKIAELIRFFSFIFSLFYLMFVTVDYSSIFNSRKKYNEDKDSIIKYFEDKKRELKNSNGKRNVFYNNCPECSYYLRAKAHEGTNTINLSFMLLNLILVFLLHTTTFKINEGSGTFDSIHYTGENYVLFENNNGYIEKINFPNELNTIIKRGEKRSYEYKWLQKEEHNYVRDKDNKRNYLKITIKETDKINGTVFVN